MKTLNKIQLIVIIALVVLGAYTFGSPYLIRKSGVAVVSVSNPSCNNVNPGDIITEVGGNQINSIQDFNSLKFSSNQFISLVVNAGPGGCVALSDGSIGISATDVVSQKIQYGVDLVGGKEYTVDTSTIPTGQIQNVSNILNVRTVYLGLAGTNVEVVGGQLKIIAGTNTNVNQLLFRGNLEGNIQEGIAFQNGQGNLMIGNDNFTVQMIGSNYKINGSTYSQGGSFYLDGVKTTITNNTNTSVILSLTFLNNSDVLGEVPGYQQTSFDSTTGNYNFNTLVSIDSAAGKRFNAITQNIKTTVIGNQINLDAALAFTLDGDSLSNLGIPVSLKGQSLANIYVIVVDQSRDSLLSKEALVKAAIHSGTLPSALAISSSKNIIPSQTNNAILSLGIIVFALVVAPVAAGTKYKKFKHNSLSILIGAAEIFAIVSIFVAFQIFSKINVTFDFPAVVGITLVAINWMVNVISINLFSHAQKDLIVKLGYRKLFSVTALSKILLFVSAIVFAALGYGTAGITILIGLFLDIVIFRSFYKSFVS